MPVMHMHLWKALPVPWLSDGARDAATRFGFSIGGSLSAISASGFLLEIVAMVLLLCGALLSGQFGF